MSKRDKFAQQLAFRTACIELEKKHKTRVIFEYRFHDTRKWRFDAAYPKLKIAVEHDGGVWTGGRHTRGIGFIHDCEKINTAQLMGWVVYRFVPDDVTSGKFADVMEMALGGKEAA